MWSCKTNFLVHNFLAPELPVSLGSRENCQKFKKTSTTSCIGSVPLLWRIQIPLPYWAFRYNEHDANKDTKCYSRGTFTLKFITERMGRKCFHTCLWFCSLLASLKLSHCSALLATQSLLVTVRSVRILLECLLVPTKCLRLTRRYFNFGGGFRGGSLTGTMGYHNPCARFSTPGFDCDIIFSSDSIRIHDHVCLKKLVGESAFMLAYAMSAGVTLQNRVHLMQATKRVSEGNQRFITEVSMVPYKGRMSSK